MAQNAAAATAATEALPASVLYALLTALDPKKLLERQPRPGRGEKVDRSARRDFENAVKAAGKAKSAAEFAKLIGAADTQEAPGAHGPIVGLEVFYSDGWTLIRIRYADGVTYDHFYPAGTL